MNAKRMLKFSELPQKYQSEVRSWAVDAWNEIYKEQGLPLIGPYEPEVEELLEEWEFEIERGTIDGIRYERLERCY